MLAFITWIGLLCMFGGGIAAFFELISPFLGLSLVVGGLVLLALNFFFVVVSFTNKNRTSNNLLGFFAGLAALASIGGLAYLGITHPALDVSTDITSPPNFIRPVYPFKVDRGGEFLDPNLQIQRNFDGAAKEAQAQAGHDFHSISVYAPQPVIYKRAVQTIRENAPHWRLVLDNPKTFHAEWERESPVFHFIDDMVLEVRTDAQGQSKVDLRIRSRRLFSDFGESASQLQNFLSHLEAALKPLGSTPPAPAIRPAETARPGTPPAAQAAAPAAPVQPAPVPAPAPKPSPAKNLTTPSSPEEL